MPATVSTMTEASGGNAPRRRATGRNCSTPSKKNASGPISSA